MTDEIPPPRQEYKIQRRGIRVRLRAGTPAKLRFWDAALRNISRSGVLLEHHTGAGRGTVLALVSGRRPPPQGDGSRGPPSHQPLHHCGRGEQQIVYHTGMEFTALTDDTVALVSAYIDHLRAADLAP